MKPFEKGEDVIVLGLMSGTSLDGIDAALIKTNGIDVSDIGPGISIPYSSEFRARLKQGVEAAGVEDTPVSDESLIRDITGLHVEAIQQLLSQESCDSKWGRPQLIGFHGHTTLHRPSRRYTQQIGDSVQLADVTQIPVVSDFRKQDVEAGGQGAPLVPIFHSALCRSQEKPACFVNIGGIANVTWIGNAEDDLVAFDTGTGNGLLDAWVEQKIGKRFDEGGALAGSGQSCASTLCALMKHPYFSQTYPKSLDRSDFNLDLLAGLSVEDGAATLVSFTVSSILQGLEQCPSPPLSLYVTGGGRHNKTMMAQLSARSPCPTYPVERHGWNGDFIEAQAFAFLAARRCLDLPITFPQTTGAASPMTGGQITYPQQVRV